MVGTKAFAVERDSDGSHSLCNAVGVRKTPVKRPAVIASIKQQLQHPKTVGAQNRTSRQPHQQNAGVRVPPRSYVLPARGTRQRYGEDMVVVAPTVAAGSGSACLWQSEKQTVENSNDDNIVSSSGTTSARYQEHQQESSPLQTTVRTPTPTPASRGRPGREAPPPPAADWGSRVAEPKIIGENNSSRTTTTVRKLHTSQEVVAVATRAETLSPPAPAEQRLGRKANMEVS